MAKQALPAALLGRLTALLDRIPFLPKKPAPSRKGDEPFESLEDASPDSDESFEPNAISLGGERVDRRLRIDFGGLLQAFLGNHLAVGLVVAAMLVGLGIAVASIVEQAEPRELGAIEKPITPEGRSAAARFILPPDPALSMEPPMERPRRFPYTDEDMKRLEPETSEKDLPLLISKNDKAIEALFQAVK